MWEASVRWGKDPPLTTQSLTHVAGNENGGKCGA